MIRLITLISEKIRKDIYDDDPEFLARRDKAKKGKGSKYISTDRQGVVKFVTKSFTDGRGASQYDQTVQLMDLPTLRDKFKKTKTPKEIVDMAVRSSNLKLHCTDPSWKYWGYQYKATKQGYSAEPETRSAPIRNPKNKGSVCKHLDNVLYILPFLSTKITADLKKSGYFK